MTLLRLNKKYLVQLVSGHHGFKISQRVNQLFLAAPVQIFKDILKLSAGEKLKIQASCQGLIHQALVLFLYGFADLQKLIPGIPGEAFSDPVSKTCSQFLVGKAKDQLFFKGIDFGGFISPVIVVNNQFPFTLFHCEAGKLVFIQIGDMYKLQVNLKKHFGVRPLIGAGGHRITVALVKNRIVFSDPIRNPGDFPNGNRYKGLKIFKLSQPLHVRDQMGGPVYLGVGGSFQPRQSTLIQGLNVGEQPATKEVVLDIFKALWKALHNAFKWIKQNLTIKKLWGHSENAVNIHIWVAICTYLIVAHVKHALKSSLSIYEIMQILGISSFDKSPIKELLTEPQVNQDVKEQYDLFSF